MGINSWEYKKAKDSLIFVCKEIVAIHCLVLIWDTRLVVVKCIKSIAVPVAVHTVYNFSTTNSGNDIIVWRQDEVLGIALYSSRSSNQ